MPDGNLRDAPIKSSVKNSKPSAKITRVKVDKKVGPRRK